KGACSRTCDTSGVLRSALKTRRTSSRRWPRIPTVSKEGLMAFKPLLGRAPKLGLKPYIPQKVAGPTTDPAVWVPKATGTTLAATAAAEPDEDPPGVCSRFQGLQVLGGLNKANSVVTVLPNGTA